MCRIYNIVNPRRGIRTLTRSALEAAALTIELDGACCCQLQPSLRAAASLRQASGDSHERSCSNPSRRRGRPARCDLRSFTWRAAAHLVGLFPGSDTGLSDADGSCQPDLPNCELSLRSTRQELLFEPPQRHGHATVEPARARLTLARAPRPGARSSTANTINAACCCQLATGATRCTGTRLAGLPRPFVPTEGAREFAWSGWSLGGSSRPRVREPRSPRSSCRRSHRTAGIMGTVAPAEVSVAEAARSAGPAELRIQPPCSAP